MKRRRKIEGEFAVLAGVRLYVTWFCLLRMGGYLRGNEARTVVVGGEVRMVMGC